VGTGLGSVYVVWGSTYLAIALVVETIPPLLSAGTRFIVAGALLYPIARRLAGTDSPTKAHWLSALTVGGLLVGANGLLSIGEKSVPSGIASLLIATVPFWMVLLTTVFFRQRAGAAEWVGILIGFFGVALLIGEPGGSASPVDALVVLVASVAWAAGSVLAPRLSSPSTILLAVSMQMLAGGVLMSLAGLLAGELSRFRPSEVSTASVAGFIYLIVISSMIVFPVYVWLLGVAPTSLVSTYAYVNPLIAVVLGWIILDEGLDARTIIGGGLIVAAVFVIMTAVSLRADRPRRVLLRRLRRAPP
jgi:drug/metabolite transporter (DMT)-like permease